MEKLEKLVVSLMGIQAALATVAGIANPGFDKPNSIGLSFGFYQLLAVVFAMLWLSGFVFSFQLEKRKWLYVVLQLLSPFLCISLVLGLNQLGAF
jgi:hypothetical protein